MRQALMHWLAQSLTLQITKMSHSITPYIAACQLRRNQHRSHQRSHSWNPNSTETSHSKTTTTHYRTIQPREHLFPQKTMLQKMMWPRQHQHIGNSTFQDHVPKVTSQSIGNNALQDPTSKSIENKSLQDHNFTVKDVWDMISLKNAFPQSFDTTSNMHGVYTICFDPSVPQVQHARHKIPIECREAIEKLQDMMDQGFITPVTEPMEWMSSLTYPWKPDGSLWICLDPKDLNKVIIWEHYKAPTLDEITHKLSRAKVFSKLDAKDWFWSIHLNTLSSYLTAFNTHKGCYWFLCMPFGLNMSHLPGIIAIHDDPYGKDLAGHDHNLLQLMKTAQGHGLVFNSSKCAICQSQTSFYGAIFTAQGMRADPAKVQALQDLPAPPNPKQL